VIARSRPHALAAFAFLPLIALPLVSCQRPVAPPAGEDKLVVFAATSLRDAFTTLSDEFGRTHPAVEVTLNFAGTQELRTQLEHGAPADVFASADQRHMDALVQAKRVWDPQIFARNEPVVVVGKVVGKEQAQIVTTFFDLPRAQRIVVGAPDVPIGRYTLQILDRASEGTDFRARVLARVVSHELNVRQVLAKVALGEADAGIVYRTDAQAAGARVMTVTIPPAVNVMADYPIAVVTEGKSRRLAQAWIDLVMSAPGQAALRRAGFIAGPATR
jgi:molybdate transport system substrate-binding protein